MFKATVVLLCLTIYVISVTSSARCPEIVSRAGWGARAAKQWRSISVPLSKVVIHHTETPSCYSKASCAARVRSMQNYHMNTRKWWDIGYHFIVGEDGRVYEGRGWYNEGGHATNWNSISYGIAIIGNFQYRLPNTAALNAVKALIACAQPRYLRTWYSLYGHRDTKSTSCPGNRLYSEIKTWPRFFQRG